MRSVIEKAEGYSEYLRDIPALCATPLPPYNCFLAKAQRFVAWDDLRSHLKTTQDVCSIARRSCLFGKVRRIL